MTITPIPTPQESGQVRPSHPDPGPRGHIGWIVAGSLVTGLVVGLILVAAPFIPAEESELTGALLCGFHRPQLKACYNVAPKGRKAFEWIEVDN